MREANWDDVFQKRHDVATPDETRLSAVIPWEEWLTLVIVTVVFLACVSSIQGANWVDDMPSMYPVGFAGLVAGYALSRVRWNELLLHPIALFGGATVVYLQLLAIVPGGTPAARTDQILDRMYVWWSAVTQDGISNDSLPFITVLLVLTFLGAYISTWAVFRWRNVWLGLIPSGFGMLWNISFIPGQFSYAFVIFCFGAVLLVMRVHLEQRQRAWDRENIHYPEFMSLSVLHATFWVTIAMLVGVWLVPLAHRSESASERWNDFTAPVARVFAPYARVFISVNAKKPINVHNLDGVLPFQGKITLSSREAVEIEVELTDQMARFLREQSFDEYTSAGWKINVNGVPIDAGQPTGADADAAEGSRQEVTISITVKGGNDNHLFSLGQPVQSDQPADAQVGADPSDVSSLEAAVDLDNGDQYTVTGSVTVASIERLLASGTDYPQWVLDRYLQLPVNLPSRVYALTDDVTANTQEPFERAAAIEAFLRTYPVDFDVRETPPGRDTIDYFLFDLERGYFDYHASAMAVMLRTQGIPARVATGYVIDPLAEGEGNRYELTQKHAYAWPEVYFPGVGWVEFSPTPDRPLILRPRETPLPEEDTTDAPTGGSERGLSDFDLSGLEEDPAEAFVPVEDASSEGSGSGLSLLIALAVIGGAIIVLGTAGRFAWEYGLGGLSPAARIWEKTARLARFSKLSPTPSETPREYAARLRREVPGAGAAGFLASRYESSRYSSGSPASDPEAEKLETAWSSLRNALLRRALRLRPRS
jgi:transglutaminase-like putative cysteine protease